MPIDDVLPESLSRWQRQHIDVVAALIALGVGVWFAYAAWQNHDWLFGLSAFTLLLVCPAFAISLVRTRRLSVDWSDKTPEGALQLPRCCG